MTDSCCEVFEKGACPLCGKKGAATGRDVPGRHLTAAALEKTAGWKLVSVCLNPDCEALYFEGTSWVSHRESKTRVGFKEKEPPHPLCYCFRHSGEEMLQEIREHGKPLAVEHIKREVRARTCRCEETNPTGLCCLGTIQTFLKRRTPVEGRLGASGAAGESLVRKLAAASVLTVSACCGIPLLLALLGVGVGIGGFLGAAHLPLSVLGFLLVGAGFLLYFREKRACAARGCAMEGRRSSLAVLVLAAAFVSGFTLWGSGVFARGGTRSIPPGEGLRFTVEGMTCAGCAAQVKAVVGRVPGVERVEVDLKGKEAVVLGGPSLSPEEVVRAIEGAGYGAEFKKDK